MLVWLGVLLNFDAGDVGQSSIADILVTIHDLCYQGFDCCVIVNELIH